VHAAEGDKMNISTENRKGNKKKIPRGYRLKISTHKKIRELQQLTNNSQEYVISRALRLYIKYLNSK